MDVLVTNHIIFYIVYSRNKNPNKAVLFIIFELIIKIRNYEIEEKKISIYFPKYISYESYYNLYCIFLKILICLWNFEIIIKIINLQIRGK